MEAEMHHWKRQAGPEDSNTRLDAFWARELEGEGVSRGKVQEWIKAGLALVDGSVRKKPKFKLAPGMELELSGQGADCRVRPEDGPLDILHEDDALVVLVKPAGLTTHPAPGEPDGTLVNRLLARYPEIASMDELRPGIVHRLDKDTSGVMVVARHERARLALAADFAERRVDKLYLALVHGVVEKDETDVNLPMGRHPRMKTRMAVVEKGGRDARSRVTRLWNDPGGRASLVAVKIFTGRTHQVRVHMAALGHPLLGDEVYGGERCAVWKREAGSLATLAPRQMLHAYTLGFTHPESGEPMAFAETPPEDFMTLLLALGHRSLRVGITGAPGSGKSALSNSMRELGCPVFSADACVTELYGPGGDGAVQLAARFGGEYNADDGSVDKPALLYAMRESENVRREVMDMIHPMVRHRMEAFFAEHADETLVLAEIPLLMETGWGTGDEGPIDLSVGVDCPEELRRGSRREARGMSPELLALLDSWQWPAEKKLAACDLVVDNSGDEAALREGGRALLAELTARFEEKTRAFTAQMDDLLAGLR